MSKHFSNFALRNEFYLLIQCRGFIEPTVAGPVWFMPWLAKIAPDKTGFNNLLAAVQNLQNEFRLFIEKRKKIHSKDVENDFLDFYLTEIEKTTDEGSSFYKEVGSEFVQCNLHPKQN